MTAEVRTMPEGEIWWVQASGNSNAWATASAPASGLFGFVQSFSFTSGATITTINERGRPNHHKRTQFAPINITLQFLWTGTIPTASAQGASLPLLHLEYKASDPLGGADDKYFQFHGVAISEPAFTENLEGDTFDYPGVALGMNGVTGSGYIVS